MEKPQRLVLVLVSILVCLGVYAKLRMQKADAHVAQDKVGIQPIHRATNATVYRIQLQRAVLFVTESHDQAAYSLLEVGSPLEPEQPATFPSATPALDAFKVEILKDAEGQLSRVVALGDVIYHDLNGDGHLDHLYDAVSRQNRILLDDRLVVVQDSKTVGKHAKSLDGQTTYVFEGGAWKVQTKPRIK